MEFDKSRVYSAVNADGLHNGDKVIGANTLSKLRERVEQFEENDVVEIGYIAPDTEARRFNEDYLLAYLVERDENCTNCKHFPCNDEIEEREVDLKIYSCCGYEPKTEPKTEQKVEEKNCYNYRPFRDTDELIEEWDKKLGYRDPTGLAKPYIWVRKKDCDSELLITGYNKPDGEVFIDDAIDLTQLFDNYTFLDGSPCGVEE